MDLSSAFRKVRAEKLGFRSFQSADNNIDERPNEVAIDSVGAVRQNLSQLTALLKCSFLVFLK